MMALSCALHGLVVVLCGSLLFCACAANTESLDPARFPFTLEPALEFEYLAEPADLDGDGVDEIVGRGAVNPHHSWVTLFQQSGKIIEQINFRGSIVDLDYLDHDGDGATELVVAYVRNDSLFANFVDGRGRNVLQLFLIAGEPRRNPDGSLLPWDPIIKHIYATDLTDDGRNELVTVVFTAYARAPRGVLVHSLPDGELIGQKLVGAALHRGLSGDFNGNGKLDLAFETRATNNGADAGGFNDEHSYIIFFELSPQPEVVWFRQLGGSYTQSYLAYDDFDMDGRAEFLACLVSNNAGVISSTFEFIRPDTWTSFKRMTIETVVSWPQIVDLDRDIHPDIVAATDTDEIRIIDHRFETVRQRKFDTKITWMEIWPDLDRDGIDEIVALTVNGTVLLLSPDLRTKAVYSGVAERNTERLRGTLRQAHSSAVHAVVDREDGTSVALVLTRNRFFWIHRYGPAAGWFGGAGLIALLGFVFARQHRRRDLLERVKSAALETDARGFLLLNPDGRIPWLNSTLCDSLGFQISDERTTDVERIAAKEPALGTFLQDVLSLSPPHHFEREVSTRRNGKNRTVRVAAEPLRILRSRRAQWLLIFQLDDANADYLDAKTWAMMAKKVTHDIKNPLTNILLTTQRLQAEYRKRAPEASEAFEPFTERIVERVTHLRRMTKQFMKIIDLEAIDPVKTDLTTFVHKAAGRLTQDLPPDIELILDTRADLPAVDVDRDQLLTVLENLFDNAVRALPDGGAITISTYPVLNLRAAQSGYTPTDYVVLEVQDNGVGIPEEDRARMFDPGFTTAEFGTGLGLALTRRVLHQHRGFVEVESHVGVGAIFSLHFPVAAERS